MTDTPAPPPPPDIPETDDPVVLRELLRQAREHLRVRESIEQMLAENVARTEALLVEARQARQADTALAPEAVRETITEARVALRHATAAIERIAAMLPDPADDAPPMPDETTDSTPATPATTGGPRTVEVLMEEVTSPAIARSVQQYLNDLEQVTRAEVRELAEGLLRITVETTAPLTGAALAGWEPERKRTVRTERPDVLAIELDA